MSTPFFRTFTEPVFSQAILEIELLGLRVSEKAEYGSRSYMVIGGRSNRRWWMVPLANRNVTVSGLAMFQPVIPSAKIVKSFAVFASTLGISSLWARKKIYISGKSHLVDVFLDTDLHYAFFTGTDSPHRKLAVQVMDDTGVIKGFAKISPNPAVKPLLSHEAATLEYLRSLGLQTAHIPAVLYYEERGGASILVTDSLKTARTKTSNKLNAAHFAFLAELASKTAVHNPICKDGLTTELQRRYSAVAERLSSEWQRRLEQSIERISQGGQTLGPSVLSHGDFTPWNTFFANDKLYVFDWEYAEHVYPAGFDLIHFMLSRPQTNRQPAAVTVEKIRKILGQKKFAGSDNAADLIMMTYLCGQTLLYIGRVPVSDDKVNTWDGAEEMAAMFDVLMSRMD